MFHSKFIVDFEDHKLSTFPIVYASLNSTTNILGVCSGDGSILLSNICYSNVNIQSSTIQMDIEHINKFIWLNNYEIAAIGSGGYLKYFSIMNLKEESYKLHQSGIISVKQKHNQIFTGSSDGSVCNLDIRTKKQTVEIKHKIKNLSQPIKEIEINENYLYSSTVYCGRLWIWDMRNSKKPINRIETKNCQNSLLFLDGSLLGGNNSGITRFSPTLELNENWYKQEPCQPSNNNLEFINRFESLVFSTKDSLIIKGTKFKEKRADLCTSQLGILGFSLFHSNKILEYFLDGRIKIGTVREEPV